MKVLTTVISSVAVGLMLAANEFNPIFELQRLLTHRRRIFYAALTGAFAFAFVFAGIVTAAIEAGLQYDAQGFVLWSALFSVAAGFGAVGVACLILARALFPKPAAPEFSWAKLDEKFHLRELLDKWMQQAAHVAEAKD